jgi:aspartyl protease family protein
MKRCEIALVTGMSAAIFTKSGVLRALAGGLAALGMLCSSPARALDVAVAGIFPGKVVLVVDGAAPRTVAVGGTTPEGVRVVAVEGEQAVVEINGRRETLRLGERVVNRGSTGAAQTVVLNANAQGHFVTTGAVNGAPVTFIVDTGATTVTLGSTDARRAGIDYRKGEAGYSMTASGPAEVWRVKLDAVRLDGVVLRDVDATVLANDLPVVLLGMSFLNRMQMERSGERMILRRRY